MTKWLATADLEQTENGNRADEYTKSSDGERELLALFAQACTSKDIAQTYALSPYTIQTYRQQIMKKLNVHNK
ncbi:response regulator transcription factor [Patescibacteria group bacterium]|nr:response regulator transcription factor [Patescibacteria group bacterium]